MSLRKYGTGEILPEPEDKPEPLTEPEREALVEEVTEESPTE